MTVRLVVVATALSGSHTGEDEPFAVAIGRYAVHAHPGVGAHAADQVHGVPAPHDVEAEVVGLEGGASQAVGRDAAGAQRVAGAVVAVGVAARRVDRAVGAMVRPGGQAPLRVIRDRAPRAVLAVDAGEAVGAGATEKAEGCKAVRPRATGGPEDVRPEAGGGVPGVGEGEHGRVAHAERHGGVAGTGPGIVGRDDAVSQTCHASGGVTQRRRGARGVALDQREADRHPVVRIAGVTERVVRHDALGWGWQTDGDNASFGRWALALNSHGQDASIQMPRVGLGHAALDADRCNTAESVKGRRNCLRQDAGGEIEHVRQIAFQPISETKQCTIRPADAVELAVGPPLVAFDDLAGDLLVQQAAGLRVAQPARDDRLAGALDGHGCEARGAVPLQFARRLAVGPDFAGQAVGVICDDAVLAVADDEGRQRRAGLVGDVGEAFAVIESAEPPGQVEGCPRAARDRVVHGDLEFVGRAGHGGRGVRRAVPVAAFDALQAARAIALQQLAPAGQEGFGRAGGRTGERRDVDRRGETGEGRGRMPAVVRKEPRGERHFGGVAIGGEDAAGEGGAGRVDTAVEARHAVAAAGFEGIGRAAALEPGGGDADAFVRREDAHHAAGVGDAPGAPGAVVFDGGRLGAAGLVEGHGLAKGVIGGSGPLGGGRPVDIQNRDRVAELPARQGPG